ncbi:DNA polymerase IV [Gracilibacillus marinus]|uniref:DNA polymerase IV n=1 Tax=Gracilibacillus marinus TaxID=630535 RepID=A0ABV8VVQ2_9BACI
MSKEWYPKKGKVILHVDMNSYYASVEIADNPALKGTPVAIAGNPDERKGIIVTSSYEARKFGVKTTMHVFEAKKLCPDLVVLKPNFNRYREVSQQIFRIFEQFTDLVEPVSIDEGYLDITECASIGTPIEIAKMIQMEVDNQLHLPCSVGIAPNKFLAKMASDMKKPYGITILRKRDIKKMLWPLPIEEMYGIGRKTAEKLKANHIHTIEEFVKTDIHKIRQLLGVNGQKLYNRAIGFDPRPVDPSQAYSFKSIGNSRTFAQDITTYEELIVQLQNLAKSVANRLERKNAVSDTVQLTIRYYNRKTVTRRTKLTTFIYTHDDIFYYSEMLLNQHWDGSPIRLLGITLQDAKKKNEASYQLSIFDKL